MGAGGRPPKTPKEDTFQSVLHNFQVAAHWTRSDLANVLGIRRRLLTDFMTGAGRMYKQDYIIRKNWAGKLENAAPEIWAVFAKDFHKKLKTLTKHLITPETNTFQRVLHDFQIAARWTRLELVNVLGVDAAHFQGFIVGKPGYAYTQRTIKQNDWAGKLEKANPETWKRFRTAFYETLSDLKVHAGGRPIKDPLRAALARQVGCGGTPTLTEQEFSNRLKVFVSSALKERGLTETTITEQLPRGASQILRTPEVWKKILSANGDARPLPKGIVKEAISQLCVLTGINPELPQTNNDFEAASLLQFVRANIHARG